MEGLDEVELEKYIKAGNITAQVLEFGKTIIKKNVSLLDATEKIEQKIFDLGGLPAFPVQIAMNETAAHFCPEDDDKTVLTDQLCCLDVGVHVDGCIGDSAVTIDLSGKHGDLIKAAEEALQAALEIVNIGQAIGSIGKRIEETIVSHGFNPVRNLSGHGLTRFGVHDSPNIPNYDTKEATMLEKGMTIAIEPFATTGAGMIHEKGNATVFDMTCKKSVRVGFVRDIFRQLEGYHGLPFTTRWLTKHFTPAQVKYALGQMRQLGILHEYPPLVERSGGFVSQAEHSVYIDDEIVVLTKL